jgi:nitrous oxide reductase accessory protein NosL
VKSRRLALAAVVAAGVVAAGCGGSHDTRAQATAQVKETVRIALADLANADGRAFCALATPAGQAKLAGTLHGYTCATLVELVAGHLSPATRTGLLHVKVRAVTVRGPTATVRAADITATEGTLKGFLNDGGKPTTLVRQHDGTWKINA